MTIVGYLAADSGQEICLTCADTTETYQPVDDSTLLPEIYMYECSTEGCGNFLVPPTNQAWAVLESHGETK